MKWRQERIFLIEAKVELQIELQNHGHVEFQMML